MFVVDCVVCCLWLFCVFVPFVYMLVLLCSCVCFVLCLSLCVLSCVFVCPCVLLLFCLGVFVIVATRVVVFVCVSS